MKKGLMLSGLAIAASAALAGLHTPAAHGFANSAPSFECMSCHTGATMNPAMIKIDNLPATYKANQSYRLTLTLNSQLESMSEQQGGFALRVSAGQLVVSDSVNTQMVGDILTHTLEGSANRSWQFTWQAPEGEAGGWLRRGQPGPDVNVTIMAVAANGDFSAIGDEVGAAGLTIKGGR